jgi:hypothetical protein
MNKNIPIIIIFVFLIFNLFNGCVEYKTREESIPDNAIKMTPETDFFPPQLHSDEYNIQFQCQDL